MTAPRSQHTCKTCGQPFAVLSSRLKYSSCPYCSQKCAQLGRHNRVTKMCVQCGKPFEVKRSHATARLYCSLQCKTIGRAMATRVCKMCGITFRCQANRIKAGAGRFCSHSCACVAITPRQYVHQSETSLERIVRGELQHRGLFFESQKRIGKYVIDFLLPMHQIVIEADGDYWHSTPEDIQKDWNRDMWFLDQGYDVLRFPENVLQEYPQRCFARLPEAGRERYVTENPLQGIIDVQR